MPTLTRVEPGWQAGDAWRRRVLRPSHPNTHQRPTETKPAAHLERELNNPSYRKRRVLVLILQPRRSLGKIEAERVRVLCRVAGTNQELAQP